MKFSDDLFEIHELQNVPASNRMTWSDTELLTVSQIIVKKCLSKKNDDFGFKTADLKPFFWQWLKDKTGYLLRSLLSYVNKTLTWEGKRICTSFISVTGTLYIIQREVALGHWGAQKVVSLNLCSQDA